MKAVVNTRYGPPEVLEFREVPKPVPGEHEILIKIHATTVNRTDLGLLNAKPFITRFFTGLFRPRFQSMGNEFAGEVEATGSEVTLFQPGDHVFGFSGKRYGAHAQYIVMEEEGPVAHMPSTMGFQEAAPMTEGSHYALNNIRAAGIEGGQRVLIYGATGAIGSAAVQLTSHLGAEVTAVCDTKNVELVSSLGAKAVIDYTKEDFTKLEPPFDVVFDAVGKCSFRKCRPLLKPGGIYMSTDLGFLSQNPFLALITPIFRGKKVLFPIPFISKKDVIYFKELAETGRFRPVIDRIYPLEQIPEAYRYVATGKKVGNVVISVDHPQG